MMQNVQQWNPLQIIEKEKLYRQNQKHKPVFSIWSSSLKISTILKKTSTISGKRIYGKFNIDKKLRIDELQI